MMALTATHCELLRSLNIQHGGTLLEIGEANWYGDVEPMAFGLQRNDDLFAVCKEFYQQWFAPSRIVSVDMNGSEAALRQDLNRPLDLGGERFDVVINHGTAEHVFNIAQVFATMHEHCEPNGWMIHDAPFHGWIDHGFYCLQPTLFYDIGLANCYEISLVALHEAKAKASILLDNRDHVAQLASEKRVPMNTLLFVAYRKRVDQPFVLPTQGYYARTLTERGTQAWRAMR